MLPDSYRILFTRLLCITVFLFSASGCASVTRGTKDKLVITSDPSGANVKLSNNQTGITPVTFKLPRKRGLAVEVSKEGYVTQTVLVSSKFSAGGGTALAGNVLIGGLIGAGVDGLTGATLSLKPNPVVVTLVPVTAAATTPPPTAPVPASPAVPTPAPASAEAPPPAPSETPPSAAPVAPAPEPAPAETPSPAASV